MLVKIEGIRTDCYTGKERKVKLQAEILVVHGGPFDGKNVFKLYGGPTGFESFYITPQTFKDYEDDRNFWVACMGDIGYNVPIYDKLVISAVEMRKVLKGGK